MNMSSYTIVWELDPRFYSSIHALLIRGNLGFLIKAYELSVFDIILVHMVKIHHKLHIKQNLHNIGYSPMEFWNAALFRFE